MTFKRIFYLLMVACLCMQGMIYARVMTPDLENLLKQNGASPQDLQRLSADTPEVVESPKLDMRDRPDKFGGDAKPVLSAL